MATHSSTLAWKIPRTEEPGGLQPMGSLRVPLRGLEGVPGLPGAPQPTLCDPADCSPPGSSVNGIFQARVLEWGAIAFSKSS